MTSWFLRLRGAESAYRHHEISELAGAGRLRALVRSPGGCVGAGEGQFLGSSAGGAGTGMLGPAQRSGNDDTIMKAEGIVHRSSPARRPQQGIVGEDDRVTDVRAALTAESLESLDILDHVVPRQ